MKKSALRKSHLSKTALSVTGIQEDHCCVEALDSQPIKTGRGNLGVYKHTLRVAREKEEKRFCLIEKVTRRPVEVKIAKALYERGAHLSTLPKVYDVVDRSRFSSIFMEYVPLLEGREPSDVVDFFYRLSASVSLFNQSYSFIGELFDYDEVYNKKHERLCGLVSSSCLDKELRAEVLDKVSFLFESFGPKGMVVSHNDLAGPNIYLPSADADEICFIDFGLVSPNFPGADFHHFVRSFLFRSRLKKVRRAIKAYAINGGYDKSAVAISAYSYALHRSLARLHRLERSGSESRIAKETKICQELASALVKINP